MTHTAARAASSYRNTEAQSRTPIELVVMLYDGALRFIAVARAAMERGDIPARAEAVSRALAIVSELQNTLDLEKGGEVAERLDGLYQFVTGRLMDASFTRNLASLDEATRVLAELRSAWSAVAAGTPPPAEPGR